jgi:hypothetical protein
MAEQYGTNLPGLTGYEGDVTADGGETLIGSDSDGATALLFGPAALREIQAGIANGDFASAPDDPDSDVTESNPLPYFTADDSSGGSITARVIEDASAGSGNVLRFRIAGGTTSGNSLTISRFVPVPGTRNRSFVFTPEVYCINATSTSNAKVVLSYQYYEIDAETTTGTGDTRERTLAEIGSADTLRIASNYTRLAIPSDAAFILVSIKVETTGTVSSQSDVSIAELRLISGGSDLYIAENSTPATYGPARLRQVNGELTITPNLGGAGTVVIDGTLNLGATTFSSLTVSGTAGSTAISVTNGNIVANNGFVRALRGTAGNAVFTGAISGDAGDRIRIEADGRIEWGDGTGSSGDVNLYRDSSTRLKTDDSFESGGSITANGQVIAGTTLFGGALVCDAITTTASSSNEAIWVNIGGTEYALRRFTSSSRYKTNVVPADSIVLEAAKKISPKHFESLIDNPEELGKTRLGFIAEEIHEAGLTHAIGYNAEGQPESIDSVALIAALWHRVNDLEERLKALEAE